MVVLEVDGRRTKPKGVGLFDDVFSGFAEPRL